MFRILGIFRILGVRSAREFSQYKKNDAFVFWTHVCSQPVRVRSLAQRLRNVLCENPVGDSLGDFQGAFQEDSLASLVSLETSEPLRRLPRGYPWTKMTKSSSPC